MLYKDSALITIKNNKAFMRFVLSQILLSLGDAFYFIAVTSSIIQITGSGASAGFIVLSTPLSSLFLSPFAGSLGDRFKEKYLLSLIHLLRALTTLALVSNENILLIYLLVLVGSSLEILYNPPRKKIISKLMPSQDIMIGNAILAGVSGLSFILGPILAGTIIQGWGSPLIFFTISLLYFFSGILILLIKNKPEGSYGSTKTSVHIPRDIRSGILYFRSRLLIRKVVFINTIIHMLMAAINTAFYSFAFDILEINTSTWGTMMTIFYGANLVSMVLSIYLDPLIKKLDLFFIYISLGLVSLVWISYGITEYLPIILPLQLIEGLLLSMLTIFLNTKLQLISKKAFLARVISISDSLSNVTKLFSIGMTYFLLQFCSAQLIFIFNALALIFFVIIILGTHLRKKEKLFKPI